ncbi:MAG: hypothetical protein AB7G44_05145 [Bacteroidia bacterium]
MKNGWSSDLWKFREERFKGSIFTAVAGMVVLLVLILLAFAFGLG